MGVAQGNLTFCAPEKDACDLLVIAGEHSGDEQAARMITDFRALRPNANICAFGGEALKSAGAQLIFDMTSFSVVGLFEVLKNYSFFKNLMSAMVEWICTHKPKAVCFVDYPGFNLRLAAELKKRGISVKGGGDVKLLYYISPQIWAWKAGRRFKMADILDSLAVIFPFESKCYADTNLPTYFVGHPFMRDTYQAPVKYDANGEILLLAGSRNAAVSRIFPVMVATMALLENEKAVALYPTEEIKTILERVLKNNPEVAKRIRVIARPAEPLKAKAMMTSSGTMSLACSLEGIPGAIVYKANPFTYFVGRALVNIEYLGISNIILDKPAWKEFIQFEASPTKLARYMKQEVLSASARETFEGYANKLKEVLHSPPNFSAAQWLEKCMY